ncbi:MAG: hypothetical protein ACTHMI_04145 [Mucilaginibacter sp.]
MAKTLTWANPERVSGKLVVPNDDLNLWQHWVNAPLGYEKYGVSHFYYQFDLRRKSTDISAPKSWALLSVKPRAAISKELTAVNSFF